MYPQRLTVAIFLLGASALPATATCNSTQFACDIDDCRSLAVYVLSRGAGIPDEAYQAYLSARDRLENLRDQNRISRLTETRIGIEGERKLCALFEEASDAREFCRTTCEEMDDVPLINLKIEHCDYQ
jgi:hypothetical protein